MVFGTVPHVRIEPFLIQHDIRSDNSAAAASREIGAVIHKISVVRFTAAGTIGSLNTPVELKHVFAAGRLMETVNVLCDHRLEFPFRLQLGKPYMGTVRLDAVDDQLFAMETVVFLRPTFKKTVAQNRFGRILPLLVV